MHFLIDGYNLLHVGRSPKSLADLEREREHLVDLLSSYRRRRPCEVTVVFDGWQGGWVTEQRERNKGIDLIFSRRGEKADEVIKRMVAGKGSGVIVVTSDREVSRFAERMAVPVIPSEQFLAKIEQTTLRPKREEGSEEEEERGEKRKGPSRRLSKKERRRRAALKKL
jgi:predicted RNA-binding protein with PIN domain